MWVCWCQSRQCSHQQTCWQAAKSSSGCELQMQAAGAAAPRGRDSTTGSFARPPVRCPWPPHSLQVLQWPASAIGKVVGEHLWKGYDQKRSAFKHAARCGVVSTDMSSILCTRNNYARQSCRPGHMPKPTPCPRGLKPAAHQDDLHAALLHLIQHIVQASQHALCSRRRKRGGEPRLAQCRGKAVRAGAAKTANRGLSSGRCKLAATSHSGAAHLDSKHSAAVYTDRAPPTQPHQPTIEKQRGSYTAGLRGN